MSDAEITVSATTPPVGNLLMDDFTDYDVNVSHGVVQGILAFLGACVAFAIACAIWKAVTTRRKRTASSDLMGRRQSVHQPARILHVYDNKIDINDNLLDNREDGLPMSPATPPSGPVSKGVSRDYVDEELRNFRKGRHIVASPEISFSSLESLEDGDIARAIRRATIDVPEMPNFPEEYNSPLSQN